jgi:hypothetical protein
VDRLPALVSRSVRSGPGELNAGTGLLAGEIGVRGDWCDSGQRCLEWGYVDATNAVGADRVGIVAARFRTAVAHVTAEARARVGVGTVLGGVFQNRRLLEEMAALLAVRGLRVLAPVRLPPGDGRISYGQANVAAAILTSC